MVKEFFHETTWESLLRAHFALQYLKQCMAKAYIWKCFRTSWMGWDCSCPDDIHEYSVSRDALSICTWTYFVKIQNLRNVHRLRKSQYIQAFIDSFYAGFFPS